MRRCRERSSVVVALTGRVHVKLSAVASLSTREARALAGELERAAAARRPA